MASTFSPSFGKAHGKQAMGGAIPASALKALTEQKVMKVCQDKDFLPSITIGKIDEILKEPV